MHYYPGHQGDAVRVCQALAGSWTEYIKLEEPLLHVSVDCSIAVYIDITVHVFNLEISFTVYYIGRCFPSVTRPCWLPGLINNRLKSTTLTSTLAAFTTSLPKNLHSTRARFTKMSFSPPLTPLVPRTDSSPADDLVRHLSSLNLAHPDTRHDGTDQPLTGDAIDQASEGTAPYHSPLLARLLTA